MTWSRDFTHLAATANGVAVKTAYGYIRRGEGDGDGVPRKRGGATIRKVDAAMIETLVGYVEENPQLSLKEIANKLREETGVQLSTNICTAGCTRSRRSCPSR